MGKGRERDTFTTDRRTESEKSNAINGNYSGRRETSRLKNKMQAQVAAVRGLQIKLSHFELELSSLHLSVFSAVKFCKS